MEVCGFELRHRVFSVVRCGPGLEGLVRGEDGEAGKVRPEKPLYVG